MKKQRINLFLKEEQLLSDAQMNVLHGGGSPDLSPDKACSCGCQGNSSTADNKNANIKGGLTTPGFEACDSIFKPITVTWRAAESQGPFRID